MLGVRQTGRYRLRAADLARDQDLLPLICQAAERMLESYPECVAPVVNRWVGAQARYGTV